MNIDEKNGWKIQTIVDDDGHLNIFVSNKDSDEVFEVETGQGDGVDGEAFATRYSTPEIEEEGALMDLADGMGVSKAIQDDINEGGF